MLTRHPESHLDHVPAIVVTHVLERFQDRTGFFIETFELPDYHGSTPVPTLENALYGPACGDQPVAECRVFYGNRPGRTWPSRLIPRPTRQTRTCTVIAGPSAKDAGDCVVYTIFGGPASPREMSDPYRPESEEAASRAFWSEHALAQPQEASPEAACGSAAGEQP